MSDNNLSKEEELVPFGDIGLFYTRCVYGHEPLDPKFQDDFGSTVLFYKALRNYFGALQGVKTKNLFNGLISPLGNKDDPYWDGEDISIPPGIKLSNIAYGKRFYLAGETKKYYHFFCRIGDKRFTINKSSCLVKDLPEDKYRKYRLKFIEDKEKNQGFIRLVYKLPTVIYTISVIVPKEPFKGDIDAPVEPEDFIIPMVKGEKDYVERVEDFSLYHGRYVGNKIYSFYGLDIEAVKSIDKKLLEDKGIKFGEEYTRQDLLDKGINFVICY